MISEKIKQQIEKVLANLDISQVDFVVEHPAEEKFGDYSTNVALVLSKQLGENPMSIAERIYDELEKEMNSLEWLERVDIAGPGFVNFYLSDEFLTGELNEILSAGIEYGQNKSGESKKVIVEYSSPNIAKPFTVGHLRSTIIGDAIANLMKVNGWEVMRDNHLGDWGTQFGKQIYAIKTWGDASKTDYTVKELVELYVMFHEEAEKDESLNDKAREWFKKLEDGDEEARDLWQKCVDWSWVEFEKIYKRLGIKFSDEFDGGRGLGEAFFEDKMDVAIEKLNEKDMLAEGKEGAKLVFFPDDKYPPAMILKSDGATLYHTRDLATDWYRKQVYDPELIINEVGMEQRLYFEQLYEMEKMLGWYEEGQRVHVGHGLYRFSEGKMSTRKGNVIWLQEVLEEAVKRAGEMDKDGNGDAEKVAMGALKWNDLKGEARRDIVFDWDEVLNMKGNSGPYMQYAVVRAKSIVEGQKNLEAKTGERNEEEKSLLQWIYRYGEVVEDAAKKLAPHVMATYIYEMAQRFNTFYNKHSVLSAETEEKKRFRLALTAASAQIMGNGLSVLGIKVPAKM